MSSTVGGYRCLLGWNDGGGDDCARHYDRTLKKLTKKKELFHAQLA